MTRSLIRVSEYCTELQKHIVCNAPETRNQKLRHVDTCEFWKSQYERVHQANKELQGRIAVLEERQRIYEQKASPESRGLEGGLCSKNRPTGLGEAEEWLDDEVEDPIFPLGDDYLRLSSYSKFSFLVFYTTTNDLSIVLRIGRKRLGHEIIVKDTRIPEHIDILSKSTRELLQLLETTLVHIDPLDD